MPKKTQGQHKGDQMKLIIKLIGLAMLVGSGFMIYMAKVNPSEGSADAMSGWVVVAFLGFLFLFGGKYMWDVIKGIGKSF